MSALQSAARERGIPLTIFDVTLPDARSLYERNLYLLRPDCYIAWRGDELPDDVGSVLDTIVGRTPQVAPVLEASAVGNVAAN